MPRVTTYCEKANMTLAECWTHFGFDKKHGPYVDPSTWNKCFDPTCLKKIEGFTEEERDVFEVDSGDMSISAFPNLISKLNLDPIENYETEKIKAINYARAPARISQRSTDEAAWKDQMEAKLKEQAFLGGEFPTEEGHPNIFKW